MDKYQVAMICFNDNFYNMYLLPNREKLFLKVLDNNRLEMPEVKEYINLSLALKLYGENRNISKETKRKIKHGLMSSLAITVLFSTIFLTDQMHKSEQRTSEILQNVNHETIAKEIDEVMKKDFDNIKNDTFTTNSSANTVYVYDMDYLNEFLKAEDITIQKIYDRIKNNKNLSSRYQQLLYSYTDDLFSKYPSKIELRVFYENLKNLEIVECSKEELTKKTINVNSEACYVKNENKVYVLKDCDFKYGTWQYQVIFHEFSHTLRRGNIQEDGKTIVIVPNGPSFDDILTEEALNSLFTVSLLGYDEKQIAYQLQSNYHKVMIDCLDNYSLEDYANHSLSYYISSLIEFNHSNNEILKVIELINLQYQEYHNNTLKVEQSSYYPIYDYIANMYCQKNITKDMSSAEVLQVADDLIKKITYNVPSDYNIDTSRFTNDCLNYYNNIKGENMVKKRIKG